MRDKYILTAESVTEGHPDKLCDTIADSVLDACLKGDSSAHVACEVLATAGKVLVAGEISAKVMPDIPSIVCRTIREAGYTELDYEIEVITHDQSDDIAYAVREGPDGKAQVSVEYNFDIPVRLASVVLSCQHDPEKDLDQLREELMDHVIQPALRELPPDADTEILLNPSGRFVYGGFEADTGLTGRKLMVDTYGGLAPHGGGALSGKDATKVDRSGAYMARYIAKNIVSAGLADRCTVTLAYAIGKAEPVAVNVDTDGTGEYQDEVLEQAVRAVFDLTPAGMRHTLGLDKPIFAQLCNYGHFTHPDAPWEQTDKAEVLCNACRIKEAGVSDR